MIALSPGCATRTAADAGLPAGPTTPQTNEAGKRHGVEQALLDHYRAWRHVPYRYGGLSKRGIDCSGFVHVTYRDLFGIRLPRSTTVLAESGRATSRDNLETGDLVFFRTGRRTRHVGIYISGGRFMHASKSSGVMLSSLDNPYWAEHYWKSVRVNH